MIRLSPTAVRLCRAATLILGIALGAISSGAEAACGRANDPIQAALCAHPELATRDEQLNAAVTRARVARGQPENRIIGEIAKTWFDDRIDLCPKADLVCLRLIYQDQIAFWSRIDGDPDGRQRLRFVRFDHKRPAGRPDQGSFEAHFAGFVFADPQTGAQRQFNHDIDAAITDLRKAVASDADVSLRSDVEAYARTTVHAPTWTGRLLSVRLNNDTFTGGAHGLQNTWNLNLDVDAARKFRLSDRFSAKTLDAMTAVCARHLATETSSNGFDTREALYAPGGRVPSRVFRDLAQRANRWSLSGSRVRMTVPEYTLGGMALGEPVCEISAGELAGLGGCVDRSEP